MGSPSVVPDPCASTTSTSAARTRALASAARITRCCAGPFGAVRPFEAPSWFSALPATTASTGCPLRRASDRRSTISTPAPSAHPVPSAAAPNDLHRPSGDIPPCLVNPMNRPGVGSTVTPPASAIVHSPDRSAWQARCSATSAEEHAVSTVTAGPSRPKVKATRPDSTLVELAVSRYPKSAPPARATSAYPDQNAPANNPVAEPRSEPGSMPARPPAWAPPPPPPPSPAGSRQHPLLRLHRQRLARADPENPRIEPRHVVHE